MNWTQTADLQINDSLRITRHRLSNGLLVLHCFDERAPIVSYQTWFGVGARHDPEGRSGMAHLFEHLMFGKTKSTDAGQFDVRIESCGGDSNAATSCDWTMYRDTIPASEWEMVCELEADRMAHLVLEHDTVESEREVVVNERLQVVDDNVDGFAQEKLMANAYSNHPYERPIIGWMNEIKALALDDIQEFYRSHYSPNNATLVVVGGVELNDVLRVVAKNYQSLPSQNSGKPPTTARGGHASNESRTSLAWPTETARLLLAAPAPALGTETWPAFSALAAHLSGSASSVLHELLVIDREVATGISAYALPFVGPSLFQVAATATEPRHLQEIEQEVYNSIERVAKHGVSENEIFKLKNTIETAFWSELLTCNGKGEALGEYQTNLGDFALLFRTAEQFASLTSQQLQHAATQLLQAKKTIVTVVPEEETT